MINLKIDPEFQSQIPPLTDDEFKQLEENILKEGKLLSPLIVWNNTLVDGHNRYEIVQEHPEISFSTMPLPFESREEVLAWICKNQLGRSSGCRISCTICLRFGKSALARRCISASRTLNCPDRIFSCIPGIICSMISTPRMNFSDRTT